MKQTVRIIGGLYRGKKLLFPAIDGLRPTADRVKETLFNWLMHDIRNARCLDAFAGSGALGFEAFSRGASQVVFIEQAPLAYTTLLKHAQGFQSHQLTILKTNTLEYLKKTTDTFDIVFLDPPFAENYLPLCLEYLATTTVLKPDGLVYLESNHPLLLDPTHWSILKSKKAGNVMYGLYSKKP